MTATLELPKPTSTAAVAQRPDLRSEQPLVEESSFLGGFQALSDPIRLKVLELLRNKELCVGELCEALGGIAQSKLSFHLKVLKQAELIVGRQEGRWVYYRLNVAQFVVLEEYLATYRRFAQVWPSRSMD
ncbi:MAG: metalloregulator ArsR/SmtB family transcription factor [Cyanobacteria bacterium P01_D01_bin.73]